MCVRGTFLLISLMWLIACAGQDQGMTSGASDSTSQPSLDAIQGDGDGLADAEGREGPADASSSQGADDATSEVDVVEAADSDGPQQDGSSLDVEEVIDVDPPPSVDASVGDDDALPSGSDSGPEAPDAEPELDAPSEADIDGELEPDKGEDAFEPDPTVVDDDGDGYCEGGPVGEAELGCVDGALPGDCDDTEPLLNPADLDDDGFSTCQGDCDDDVPSLTPEDADGDGVSLCEGDCDDTDSAIYLGAGEVPFNGSDDDCDPSTLDDDGDGDGWPMDEDCDDSDPSIYPWAVEIPDNGIDENCDGEDARLLDQDGLDLLGADDGIIVEDSVLEPGLTYFISGDLVVPIGTTLIIGPGSELIFQGAFRVIVHGTLMVVGTPEEPVTFTSESASPGSWIGIEFNNTGTGVVAHADVSYAERGLYIEEAILEVTHTRIHNCVTGVYIEGTGASPTLTHVTVDANETGIVCSGAGWAEAVFINYAMVTHNGDGLLASGSCQLTLWNSVVGYNEDRGLLSASSTLWHNHIVGNGVGVETDGGWDMMTRNIVEQNQTGVLLGPHPVRAALNLNHLEDQSDYSVIYVGGLNDGVVNAERNWWGAASGPKIASDIWDFFDDVSLYYVDYISFLRQPLDSVGPIPLGVIDADGDHFFSVASGGNDCDDTDDEIHPDAPDDQSDGVDDDCDGLTDEDAPIDLDGDGYVYPDDCDLLDPTIHPNAHEIVDDGVDQNCNGFDMVSLSPEALGPGVIGTDAYLSPEQGLYILTGDIYVAPEMVLRMGPGTEVHFDGYWSIIVYGALEVDGQEDDPVIIRSQADTPLAGQWNRIWINDIGSGYLMHAHIMGATTGVLVEDSTFSLHHTLIRGCETGVVIEGVEASALLEHCVIEQNSLGMDASFSGWEQDIQVRHSAVRQNEDGIVATGSARLDLWSCDIADNSGVGLELDGGVVQHCRIAHNGVGVRTKGGWDTIQYTEFEANGVGLEVGSYPTQPSVRYNAFGDHEDHAVVYVGGQQDGPVDATMCWWGTTELETVSAMIWDIYDDTSLFPVLVSPLLDEPHPSVGLVPEGAVDADFDGFFSEETGGQDCDDTNSLTNPYAQDSTEDGVDNDCDGLVDEDVLTDGDNDQYLSDVDCDDADPTSYPGADEVADNGVDEDCDGFDLQTVTDDEFSGLVDRDLRFSADESPYVITGDIVVMPGHAMLIDAGAELRFDGPWMLDVKGDLLVNGSGAEPVVLTTHSDLPLPGAWKGLIVESTSTVIVEHAQISWAEIGVSIIDSEPELAHVEVHHCDEGIRIDGAIATASLINVFLHHNAVGLYGIGAGWSNAIDLIDSVISENSDGVLATLGTGLFMSGCTISDNEGVGARLSGNVVMLSLISGNGIGLATTGGFDEITYNEIVGNMLGLQIGPNPERPLIKQNSIMDNSLYGLFYVGGGVDGPVDATENWWGSAEPQAITDAIWDLYDDINLFEVLWSPALSGAHPDAGLGEP